jgi:hypothetical protein
MWIKLVLGVPLALLAVFVLTRFRHQIFYRLFFIGIAALGIYFVLNPEVTTVIAKRLGVGRGTDLIFYLSVIFFFMFSMLMYSKIRRMEAVYTHLAKNIAIRQAQKFPSK